MLFDISSCPSFSIVVVELDIGIRFLEEKALHQRTLYLHHLEAGFIMQRSGLCSRQTSFEIRKGTSVIRMESERARIILTGYPF